MRILLAGLVGGLIIFFWGAIGHMATPLGTMGLKTLPADQEAALLPTIKQAFPSKGLYIFPGGEMGKMNESETKAWEAKVKAGPVGFLVIQPDGGETITPKRLLIELGSNVLAALLAAAVLSQVVGSYSSRVGMVIVIGMIGWVSICISYWNWYAFPAEFVAAEVVMEVVGWTLAGLAIAALVKAPVIGRPSPAAT